jgi:hypothetical protein
MSENRKPPGRPKGTPNKTTAALKDAILNAFEQVGGVSYLAKVAAEDQRTFCTLLGKVLPLQVTGDGGGGIVIQVSTGVVRAPGEDPSPEV